MNLLLGIRLALTGGREAVARTALMAVGVAVGVVLVLLSLTALPIMQNHIDRLAWHRTDATDPPTASDPALWVAVTDRYADRDMIRVQVAALGAHPPVPPGVDRLPGPGEVVVSPALAALMRSVPEDQLRDRFPGTIAGTIAPAGLVMPDELVGIIGRTPEQMRRTHGVAEIRGIEQPGERLDLYGIYRVLIGMLAALIIGPVAVFVSLTARVGGVRREQRFAALRLAGATRWQTAVLASTEAAGAALAGIALGGLAFVAARPVVAGRVTLGHDTHIFAQDVRVPMAVAAVALVAVFALAIGTTLVALGAVQRDPLARSRQARRRPPQAWRLVPIAAGILGSWYAADRQRDPDFEQSVVVALVSFLAPLSIVVGFLLSGAWTCHWLSRGMAALSRRVTTLLVARRIAADPFATFRSVSGAALAIYVATVIGLLDAHGRSGATPPAPVLDENVVAVHVAGAPAGSLAPLMPGGAVAARIGPGGDIVMACADLARVAAVNCPFPADAALDDLFTLPYPGVSGADHIFTPRGFTEPDADAVGLPIQTLFIQTDGTAAARERIRTVAASAVPASRVATGGDRAASSVTSLGIVLPYAMVFVLLVAACSLTVSVINGVLERRRPLALLRASGVGIGELRRVVMLEIGVPLALSVAGGVLVGAATVWFTVSPQGWVMPGAGFFAGLGAGALAAFAVSLIALPFTDAATSYDSVRFT